MNRRETDVLFVEDDPAVRLGTTQALELAGYSVEAFTAAELVIPRLIHGSHCVLVTDLKLPGMDGLELLKKVMEIDSGIPVVLVTGHGDVSMAVQAMRLGAYDFIEKPFAREELHDVVRRAREKRALSLEVQALRSRLNDNETIEAKLIGDSSAMARLRKLVREIAPTSADVLICGETGTGKELIARSLHEHSKRSEGPFAAINCGGLPENLFESEMFGHEVGSFTGATKQRIGKLEHSTGGTLFLDEVESMPVALQVKLLRTLQERQYERLGSNELRKMDCRLVAATKIDLQASAKEHSFRQDLYYRLSVVILTVPPLRERREDIPALLNHFLLQAALRYERQIPDVSPEEMRELMGYAWPGNVRELRNAADRMVLGVRNFEESASQDGPRSLDEQVDAIERHLIEQALVACHGRAAAASELLRVPKKTLYDKMKRLGVVPDDYRANLGDARSPPS
jgi:two-component system C4-dicarboxylate transport response regulator DctD